MVRDPGGWTDAERAGALGLWEHRPMMRTDMGAPLPWDLMPTYLKVRYLGMARAVLQAPPLPPVPVPATGVSPGLVWVEDRGFVRPSVARTYEALGHVVDWHRWSPGSGEARKDLPFID